MKVSAHPEIGNKAFFRRTISAQIHLLGSVLAIIGMVVLLHFVRLKHAQNHLLACSVFGITSIMVFATSSAYHFLNDGLRISSNLEKVLEDLDHFAIYLFIAGTYTPILLNAVSNPWGNILLWAVWCISIFGVLYTSLKSYFPLWAQNRYLYTGVFVAMGWLIIFRLRELIANLSSFALWMFMLGGLSYSVGAVVYATKRPHLFRGVFGFHELWHIMVLLGYAFHYATILSFYWN